MNTSASRLLKCGSESATVMVPSAKIWLEFRLRWVTSNRLTGSLTQRVEMERWKWAVLVKVGWVLAGAGRLWARN